jgi:hypothetical protein
MILGKLDEYEFHHKKEFGIVLHELQEDPGCVRWSTKSYMILWGDGSQEDEHENYIKLYYEVIP